MAWRQAGREIQGGGLIGAAVIMVIVVGIQGQLLWGAGALALSIIAGTSIGSRDPLTRALGAVFGTTMMGYGLIGGYVVGSYLLLGELLAISIIGGLGAYFVAEEISSS